MKNINLDTPKEHVYPNPLPLKPDIHLKPDPWLQTVKEASLDMIVKALNKVILDQALFMVLYCKVLNELNDFITSAAATELKLSSDISDFTSFLEKSQKMSTLMYALFAGNMVNFAIPDEESGKDGILSNIKSKLDSSTASMFKDAMFYSILCQGAVSAANSYFQLKIGDATSLNTKYNAAVELFRSNQDTITSGFSKVSKAMRDFVNAIKQMIQNDYRAKSKGLYFYGR